MRSTRRVPPGRAGRLWLSRRKDAAERGRDQLDRKLRILTRDQRRMRILADRTRAEWRTAYAEADTWLLRLALLGGQDAVRSASAVSRAEVEVTWVSAMGVTYPAAVDPAGGDPGAGSGVGDEGSAAVAPTRAAFRAALLAGARCAAAEEAQRRLEHEIALTRRRLQALQKRWLPWLVEELRTRELLLEQAEQEDAVRARRARALPPGPEVTT
jgi:V/A-type H+-transporting ATPase subunit D